LPGRRAIAAGAKISQRITPMDLAVVEPKRRERIQEMPRRRIIRGRKMTAMPRAWRRRSER
jgi:hypothetical protein